MLNKQQKELFAILFASGDPVELDRLAQALELDMPTADRLVASVADYLEEDGSPLRLIRLEDHCQLCTREEYAPVVRRAMEIRRNVPLSQAAMECLAIIAYNQPVTRGFVEQVRGVDSSGVVSSLVEKGLIEEAGRMDLPGRPISYRTTALFLRCFGLASLEELPSVAYEEGAQPPEDDPPLEGQMGFDDTLPQTDD